jgi:hypothetical protein
MSTDAQEKARAFRDTIMQKLNRTVQEFASGQISREQFQAIYTRYTDQLTIANLAVASGDSGELDLVSGDGTTTIAMRSALQGKAVGLMIYHTKSGTIVETLGNPDVPIATIGPLLNDMSGDVSRGRHVEPTVKKLGDKQWLVLAAGLYTILVTQFRHEPAPRQIKEMTRLHTDFEEANKVALSRGMPSADDLASPFLAFVEKRRK